MAKRRQGPRDEILMVPFLDILCSLIGVLVLIIVFLFVSQARQTEGRTEDEVERAIQYKRLTKLKAENDTKVEIAKVKLERIAGLQKEVEETELKLARFRKLLSASAEAKQAQEKMSLEMAKELDNLLLEIEGYLKQQADLKKELAALLAEIEKRKPPATPQAPPVIVQPSGSGGVAPGSKVFFVEAASGRIFIYWDENQKTQVSSAPEVIIADTSYDFFLKEVKKQGGSKIVFLVRDDGLGSYNNAAGWAQQTHQFDATQVAKLPIPGRGPVDLATFREYIGRIPPPPDAPLAPPPGAPAPAPAPAPPATPKAPAPPPPAKA